MNLSYMNGRTKAFAENVKTNRCSSTSTFWTSGYRASCNMRSIVSPLEYDFVMSTWLRLPTEHRCRRKCPP